MTVIEHLPFPKLVIDPPRPVIGVKERALIECGCHVWVGMRMDNREVATLTVPCSPGHSELMHHFNMLLAESTIEPTDDPLVVVCERLLEESVRHRVDLTTP